MNAWWLSAASWNSFAPNLANHLWQTTLCVIAAAVLVRLMGARHPRVRHAIWLAASVKFLVPFSVFVAAGQALAREAQPVLMIPAALPSLEIISRPFVVWAEAPAEAPSSLVGLMMPALATIWLVGGAVACAVRWTRWRRMASAAMDAPVLVAGREADAVRRVVARLRCGRSLAIHESTTASGPGLVGIHRARLLWPAGLSPHLGDDEIDSIVAHEISHLRRADNLTSLVHIVVETLFWFHPMVWWLGARLVHEREQACDQDVLSLGVPPEAYAESLLKVCRFSLRSPQPFVAGMTGSDLSQRVEAIMTYRSRSSLSVGRRVLIAVVAALTFAGPVAAGAITPPRQTMGDTVPGLVELVAPFSEPTPVNDRSVTTSAPAVQNPSDAEFVGATRAGRMRALKMVQPVYTDEARRAGIEGSVELEAIVLPNGTVGAVRIMKSLDPTYGLDAQAVAVARQWIFAPPVDVNGQPIRAVVTLILDFRLQSTPVPVRTATEPASQVESQVTEALSRLQEAARLLRQETAAQAQAAADNANAEDLEFRRGAVSPHTAELTPAKALRQFQPTYTSSAMRAKVQGSVEVEIVVGPDGTVERARVVRSLDREHGLDEQALIAARRWRFEPATLNGQPVAIWMRLVLDFRLY